MFVEIFEKSEFSTRDELIRQLDPSPLEVVQVLLSIGWTQKRIALESGVSQARVSNIKQGDHQGSEADRQKLGALLQLPARWLIG